MTQGFEPSSVLKWTEMGASSSVVGILRRELVEIFRRSSSGWRGGGGVSMSSSFSACSLAWDGYVQTNEVDGERSVEAGELTRYCVGCLNDKKARKSRQRRKFPATSTGRTLNQYKK